MSSERKPVSLRDLIVGRYIDCISFLRAEYVLDVIGAGATATSEQDWYNIWKAPPESVAVQEEVNKIHTEGRSRPGRYPELAVEY
jgi:hypothetical protein